jgi:hypothetical protein
MPVHRAELLRRIETEVERHGSMNRAAQVFGVSPQMLSAVLSGQRNLGPKFLKGLRVKRTIVKTITYEDLPKGRP